MKLRRETGREVARFEGDKKNGTIRISAYFKITATQKWCRIGLAFRFSETVKWYGYEPSIGLQFNNYRLSLADHSGKVLFTEKRSLMEFASLFRTAYAGQRFLGKYTATHRGEVAILDFIPPRPGRYKLDFELSADEDFSEPGRRRTTIFQEFTLWVREGVKPFKGAHKRIDLMKVRDIMTRPVIAEDEEVLVTQIVKDMAERGIGSVVITSGGKPAGIITDRDIVSRVLLRDRDASEVKAKEIMSSPLITIEPETSVEEACELVVEKGIKRLPVVESGALIGVVSIGNILTKKPGCIKRVYHPEARSLASRCKRAVHSALTYLFRKSGRAGEGTVREIMTRSVITEDEDTPVSKIAANMDQGAECVVITASGRPVGIITERDVALKVLSKSRRAGEVRAREIMATPLVTIKPEASIDEMCKLVAKTHIKRLPVVENGMLVGIATTRELLTRKPECAREFYSR